MSISPGSRLFPPSLRAGDTVAFVAPAGVVDLASVGRASERFQSMGLKIKTYGDLGRQRGYLAGSDKLRADELMSAFRDPEVKAVLPVRGGYGCMRLLDRLDYGEIQRQPKIFAGFSDNTALHLALQTQCRLVTFHSPHPMDGWGQTADPHPMATSAFRSALFGDGSPSAAAGYPVELDDASLAALQTIAPGCARGPLVGGNLALVCALLGTPYEIASEGSVLFLEDTGEPPYRIDRLLAQLRLSGKLDHVAAVLLGGFTDCPSSAPPSLSLEQVLSDYFDGFPVPVLGGFPAGHLPANVTLPLGVTAEIDADRQRVQVRECPTIGR